MRNSGPIRVLSHTFHNTDYQRMLRRLVIFVSLLMPLTLVLAEQNQTKQNQVEIQAWLKKMHSAMHGLNYEGIFVYSQHNQLSSMKIIHSVDAKGEHERLISMDGSGREVIRDNNKVTCYLPDRHSVVVVGKSRSSNNFPPRFPIDVQALEKNYYLSLAGKGKVAGYISQKITILPKDKFRYGYHLWVEEKTGLLLKTHLVVEDDTPIEQFMFTQLRFYNQIPKVLLKPGVDSSKFNWYESPTKKQQAPGKIKINWRVKQLPAGFLLDMKRMTTLPENLMPVEHLIYSDGLATVSVFIEDMMDSENNLRGGSHMGAVHAFGRAVADHYVTVIGEVPYVTVKMIGESITPDVKISKKQ